MKNTGDTELHENPLEYYYANDAGAFFWIYESDGIITRDEVKLKTQKTEKIISGVTVGLAQEISNTTKFRKNLQYPYIEAVWNYKDANFNIRTDMISSEDVEKIIASMIQ
jgi:hypothetical protein